jgi:hypothetical protein
LLPRTCFIRRLQNGRSSAVFVGPRQSERCVFEGLESSFATQSGLFEVNIEQRVLDEVVVRPIWAVLYHECEKPFPLDLSRVFAMFQTSPPITRKFAATQIREHGHRNNTS